MHKINGDIDYPCNYSTSVVTIKQLSSSEFSHFGEINLMTHTKINIPVVHIRSKTNRLFFALMQRTNDCIATKVNTALIAVSVSGFVVKLRQYMYRLVQGSC